jgi:hypothetical protein
MDNSFAALRQNVLKAVAEQKAPSAHPARNRQRVLTEFIRLRLAELKLSEQNLAQRIDLPLEQVQGFLDNTLPVLDDARLQQIAAVLGDEPGLLRVILTGAPGTGTSEHPAKIRRAP